MVGKLNRLASGTEKALQEFACVGSSVAIFDALPSFTEYRRRV